MFIPLKRLSMLSIFLREINHLMRNIRPIIEPFVGKFYVFEAVFLYGPRFAGGAFSNIFAISSNDQSVVVTPAAIAGVQPSV
jgi:hypothetical protein